AEELTVAAVPTPQRGATSQLFQPLRQRTTAAAAAESQGAHPHQTIEPIGGFWGSGASLCIVGASLATVSSNPNAESVGVHFVHHRLKVSRKGAISTTDL